MAAGNTYVALATNTLSSATASVTFSSISGAYTDLVLVTNCGQSQSAYLRMYFNGDTGANYSGTWLAGNGTAAESGGYTSALYWIGGAVNPSTSSIEYLQTLNIMSYSNTTTYKTVLSRLGRASAGSGAVVGLWRNTNAITSITIDTVDSSSANYVSGSTFTLYGIAAA